MQRIKGDPTNYDKDKENAMIEGKVHDFQYQTWDSSQWTASLQDEELQNNVLGMNTGAIDPDWHHVGPWPHDDEWIRYKAWDGSHWASKCHAHTGGLSEVRFSFEHFKDSDLNHSDHEDSFLGFLDWNGVPWQIEGVTLPPLGAGKTPIMLNLRSRANAH